MRRALVAVAVVRESQASGRATFVAVHTMHDLKLPATRLSGDASAVQIGQLRQLQCLIEPDPLRFLSSRFLVEFCHPPDSLLVCHTYCLWLARVAARAFKLACIQ